MARDVVERVIGPHTYKVTLLGAKAGTRMSVRLVKLMGPTLSSFVEGTVAGSKRGGDDSIAIGASEAVREIAMRLTGDDCVSIMEELAKLTVVVLDSAREPQLSAIFDDHFAGHYDHLLAWTAFALEANFRSFFAGSAVVGLFGKLMTLIESASPSPTASSGTSTASPPASTTAQA